MRVRRFDEVDSTMTIAANVLRGEGHCFDAIVAQSQSAGRGRHGREWLASPGQNLNATYIQPADTTTPAWTFGFIMALAVCDVVDLELKQSGEITQLRWPNDVMLQGCKLCGILVE